VERAKAEALAYLDATTTMGRVLHPTHRDEAAMNGAPISCGRLREDNGNGKSEIQGFFASLRMTNKNNCDGNSTSRSPSG
jgi:hypothetical protein